MLKPLIITNAKNANLQLLSGDIAKNKNKPAFAQQYYLNALKFNNNYQLAAIKLYNLAKDENIGRKSFEPLMLNIITKHPDSHFHRFLYADYLLHKGQPEQAKLHYLVLEKKENFHKRKFVYNNLANIYLQEDLALALQYINKALVLDNVNASFLDTQGWILVLQENYQQGLNVLRLAYSMDSSNPSNRYHIAYTLAKLGRNAEALIELDIALELDTYFVEKAQTLELRSSLVN